MVEMSMYSIGSGAFLREVFNGLAMITGTGDFTKAVMIGMLFSTIVVCFQAILRGGREIAWQNILLGWILYGMFFAVPARVVVEDVYSGDVYNVDNVPLGAAAAGSMISKIGYGLTELLETGYGSADRITELPYLSSLRYLIIAQNGGHSSTMLGLVSEKTGMDVRATINQYMKNCVVPRLYVKAGLKQYASTMNVQKLLELGSDDTANGSVIYYMGNTHAESTCKATYEAIKSTILPYLTNDNFSELINQNQQSLLGSNTPDLSISGIFNNLQLTSQNQQDFILASVLRPIFNEAFTRWHSRSQTQADIMVSQAAWQRNIQWAAEQSLWSTVVHPLMTFFEGFVFAITPFVALLLCMGSMGFTLIGRYLQVLFWINLWMPIMSICNLYITLSVRGVLNTIDFGTLEGISKVVPALQNQIATGGMLMTATPMLALFVVTGSTYAFTTLTSRLNGGDHINEKMVAPDAANVGAVLDVASFGKATRGRGAWTTGTDVFGQELHFGQINSERLASAESKSRDASEAWSKAWHDDTQLRDYVQHDDKYDDKISAMAKRMFSNATDEEKATVMALVTDQGFMGKLGISTDKIPVIGQIFQASLGYYGKAGISFKYEDGAKNAIKTAIEQAGEQTMAQTTSDASGKQFSHGTGSTYQHMAQNAISARQAFMQEQSLARSVGNGFSMNSMDAGQLIAQGLQGKNKQAISEALGRGMGMVDRAKVQIRASFLQSEMGGHRTANQAWSQALMEELCNVGTSETAGVALDICRASGLNPTAGPSGNATDYAGIPNPGGLGSIETQGTPDWVRVSADKSTQKVDTGQVTHKPQKKGKGNGNGGGDGGSGKSEPTSTQKAAEEAKSNYSPTD